MSKKIQITMLFVILSLYGMAQNHLNNYKYILIPKKFDFSKSEDQYQLNSLTKFLFNKHGYEAYFLEDELPEDLKNNRCLAVTAEASNKESGLFKTKITILLNDCFGAEVVSSKVGESREKEYDKAFTEAIRAAFETYKTMDYSYLPQEIKPVLIDKVKTQVKDSEKNTGTLDSKIVKDAMLNPDDTVALYYAQPIKNGFQLVNAEPKIVMILLQTSADNVFLVKGKTAIVYKEDGLWYYSENSDELKERKPLNIKF